MADALLVKDASALLVVGLDAADVVRLAAVERGNELVEGGPELGAGGHRALLRLGRVGDLAKDARRKEAGKRWMGE